MNFVENNYKYEITNKESIFESMFKRRSLLTIVSG